MLSSAITHHSNDSILSQAWLDDEEDDNDFDDDDDCEDDDNEDDDLDDEEFDDFDNDDASDKSANKFCKDEQFSTKEYSSCSKRIKGPGRGRGRGRGRNRNRSHPQQVHQRYAANMRERKRMQSINDAFEVSLKLLFFTCLLLTVFSLPPSTGSPPANSYSAVREASVKGRHSSLGNRLHRLSRRSSQDRRIHTAAVDVVSQSLHCSASTTPEGGHQLTHRYVTV